MKDRKIVSGKRYVFAFIMGTSLFLLGIALTYSIAYLQYQRVVNLQEPTSYQIFQDKLQYSLFGKNICEEESYSKISQDLSFQGSVIGDLEEKMGKDNQDVIFRKKFYTLVQLEHLEFVKSIEKECNKSIDIVLFFYSNEKGHIKESEDMGLILGALYLKNEERMVLYSIDMNLDSEIVKSLRKKYNLTEEPVIILNEDKRFYELNNIKDIEDYLNEDIRDTIKLN